jgi:DNA (cytosine-5)-methyltransferase 1
MPISDDNAMANTDPPYYGIDLFAGVGGLSLGFSQAGIKMKMGIEVDSLAAFNLQQNNKDMDVIVSDICKIDPAQIMKQKGLRKGDISVIAGGPPCQGFSRSNHRTRKTSNPANDLYKDFFKFIKFINPEVFLFENVDGLKTLNGGEKFSDILKIASKMGYDIQWDLLNSQDFGVPQRRIRLIIVGTKNEANRSLLNEMKKNNSITVREAIDDLPIIENGNSIDRLEYSKNSNLSSFQRIMRKGCHNIVRNNLATRNGELIIKRYKHIPPGGNWKDIPSDLFSNYKNPSNCHRWIYYRLKWDEPSVVVSNFRKNMIIHPEHHRGLSIREAARLQSFPDSYIFYGRLDFQQQLVANAVPPFLATAIGKRIASYLKENL